MDLHRLLKARADSDRPIQVGLIGVGKFSSMFLSQALHTLGLQVLGMADLHLNKAYTNFAATHWPLHLYQAQSSAKALADNTTWVTDDSEALINAGGLEVVIETISDPDVGVKHALSAIDRGRHTIMVNVEVDMVAGPYLAERARQVNLVYSLAHGDQPALIVEMVDWAGSCGFQVAAAGKGTLFMPEYHAINPETVWDYYFDESGETRAKQGGMNAKMFTSFINGFKSAIEMAAVCNATGLPPAPMGLSFPACGVRGLARNLIPKAKGGLLHHMGQVEVVSSRRRNGDKIKNNLRCWVYITFEAETDFAQKCVADYGLITDVSGKYSALWRLYHLIGLELGPSVASAALLNLPTGMPDAPCADVAATVKRDLEPGDVLDGEDGYTVWGRLMSANDAVGLGAVPIGLANGAAIKNLVKNGEIVTWDDLILNTNLTEAVAYKARLKMEAKLAAGISRTEPLT